MQRAAVPRYSAGVCLRLPLPSGWRGHKHPVREFTEDDLCPQYSQ